MPEASSTASNDESIPNVEQGQPAPKGKRKYQQLQMPTADQIASEDFMNNCAVRTILSGVMGSGLGVLFGVFMGTMDSSVSWC